MRVFIGVLVAMIAMPVVASAFVNATTLDLPASVAPSATVTATLHVTLSGGDEWKATRVQIVIPGFGASNDIDSCINTENEGPNGTHQTAFTFGAPSVVGNYPITVTAYEGGPCSGENDSVSGTLHVAVLPPPPPPVCPVGTIGVWPVCITIPVDACPLVNGFQIAGPCANTLCVAPATWDVGTQACVTPPPPVDVCPLVNGEQLTGPCSDTLCVAPAIWDVVDQACEEPVVPPTPEEQCVLDGGTWNEGSCVFPEPPTPPTEAEVCATQGKTWTGSECIVSGGGGIGISLGIYCDDPIVYWMLPGAKCWDPATRPAPVVEFRGAHAPVYFYWWDSILQKMFSEVR